MLHDQLTKNLKEGETLVQIVRRDFLAELRPVALAVFLVLLDFFFLTYLVHKGPWGIGVFCVVLVVAFVIGLRALIEWQLNALLITNERIIHVLQRGYFTRMLAETTYGKVTDVRSTVKGALQTLFGLGSVEVLTAGEGSNLKIEGVRNPSQVQALLTNILRTSHEQRVGPLTAQELVAALTRAKQELGSEAFGELLTRIGDSDGKKNRK
ncbi:MAG: PH domain-containing protein [Candidatus Kerfeldbacteria bacterium]